jgi:voltage-gated potassium channel
MISTQQALEKGAVWRMRPFSLNALLRRLYLAASELHWGVMLALLLGHMTLSYLALQVAGEPDLRSPIAFIYWYLTTASTIGYGDLSPKSDAGRMVAAFLVMPGAVALFTAALARAFAGLASMWRRRRAGLGDYSEVSGLVVLVGYDRDRTPRMIAEITADRGAQEIVLVATDEMEVDDPTYRFVRAASLTAPADLKRAGVERAARVVVYAGSDAETLAATLAVTALNRGGHVVCFLRDPDTARLLNAHCPSVEVVLTPTVELVVKALSDPGSSRLIAQLASHTDEGATLYATIAPSAGRFDDLAQDLRARGAVLIATCAAGDNCPRFNLEAPIAAGDRLFYVAKQRVAA